MSWGRTPAAGRFLQIRTVLHSGCAAASGTGLPSGAKPLVGFWSLLSGLRCEGFVGCKTVRICSGGAFFSGRTFVGGGGPCRAASRASTAGSAGRRRPTPRCAPPATARSAAPRTRRKTVAAPPAASPSRRPRGGAPRGATRFRPPSFARRVRACRGGVRAVPSLSPAGGSSCLRGRPTRGAGGR